MEQLLRLKKNDLHCELYPIFKADIETFNTPTETGIYDFKLFKKAIYNGLSSRLKGWEDKK